MTVSDPRAGPSFKPNENRSYEDLATEQAADIPNKQWLSDFNRTQPLPNIPNSARQPYGASEITVKQQTASGFQRITPSQKVKLMSEAQMKAQHFMQTFINPVKKQTDNQSKLLKTNFEISSTGVIRMKESTLSPALNRVNSGSKDSFIVGRGTKGKKSDRSAHSSKQGSFIAITSQQQFNSSRENNDFVKQQHLLEQPYQIVKVHPDGHNLNQVSSGDGWLCRLTVDGSVN